MPKMNEKIIEHSPAWTLPRKDQRTVIVGKTGSGKTQMGVFLLSRANFDEQPWIIFDYKRDRLLNGINYVKPLDLNTVPVDPGMYIVHLDPGQDNEVNSFLQQISEHEDIGLYFDETYEIPDSSDFRRILTQGRSKHIPAICLTQRPVFIPRFVFTEAEHIVMFRLQHRKDRQKVEEYIPDDLLTDTSLDDRLPKYHSLWYSNDAEHVFQIGPVPEASKLRAEIERRLKALEPDTKRRWF